MSPESSSSGICCDSFTSVEMGLGDEDEEEEPGMELELELCDEVLGLTLAKAAQEEWVGLCSVLPGLVDVDVVFWLAERDWDWGWRETDERAEELEDEELVDVLLLWFFLLEEWLRWEGDEVGVAAWEKRHDVPRLQRPFK